MAEEPEGKRRIRIDVELAPEVARGQYVNMMRVAHTPTEFVIDGVYLPVQSTKAQVVARVIMNPIQAKALHHILGQNLARFEERHGTIKVSPGDGSGGTILH